MTTVITKLKELDLIPLPFDLSISKRLDKNTKHHKTIVRMC